VPSRRRAALIDAFAGRLAHEGRLPAHAALITPAGSSAEPDAYQADQANSAHQVTNVWTRLSIDPTALPTGPVLGGAVLLVDDESDSRWTLTVAATLLRAAGAGPVLPFTLRAR
jgi:ATP-dependent DNA helicase RecQ